MEQKKLTPYLSRTGAWALALGTSVGWGSLVITANTYLSQAGPLGSVLGLMIGAVIMIVISRCYHYLMNCFPDCGGAYSYARDAFGYDQGFLVAWFLMLTYLAMLWANATAIPLFARYFIGDVFRFGRMYSLFGYDVCLGEALISVAAVVLIALLCCMDRKITSYIMIGLAAVISVVISAVFIVSLFGGGGSAAPYLIPDTGALRQILHIAVISPWAFIGFENISHSTEEFKFKRKKSFGILTAAVISATALYAFIIMLSVSAFPPQYATWLEYIADLGNLSGIEALPAFYAAGHYLGQSGITALTAALAALILTSLIGNIIALSRLFCAMARDGILPKRFAETNSRGVPHRAVILIACLSAVIPFLGRTAIGWIVDVTTLGATLIYGFVSASAAHLARTRGDKTDRRLGIVGLAVMTGFMLYLLIPNLFITGSMETESYFLFVVWAVFGFIYFRVTLRRDGEKRFGKSIIVWIALLSLILFVSLVWMNRSMIEATTDAMKHVQSHYLASGIAVDEGGFITAELSSLRATNARSVIVVVALFALSLGVLLNNYALMSRRAQESESQLSAARDAINRDQLTGVKSKHAWSEKEQEADRMIQSGAADEFSVAVCDINGLKYVNDTFGHKAGDDYIRSAAMLICEIFAHSPVYRIGGDEFVVWLSGRDFASRGDLISELDRRSVGNISSGGVVVSVGVSDWKKGEDADLHSVFARADAAMYKRKQELKALGAKTRE